MQRRLGKTVLPHERRDRGRSPPVRAWYRFEEPAERSRRLLLLFLSLYIFSQSRLN